MLWYNSTKQLHKLIHEPIDLQCMKLHHGRLIGMLLQWVVCENLKSIHLHMCKDTCTFRFSYIVIQKVTWKTREQLVPFSHCTWCDLDL